MYGTLIVVLPITLIYVLRKNGGKGLLFGTSTFKVPRFSHQFITADPSKRCQIVQNVRDLTSWDIK
jgi:hypothetical protein